MIAISERQRRWWAPGTTRVSDVVLAGGLAVVLFAVLSALSGKIAVNHGYGYDGSDYVEMLNDGLAEGTPATRLRPVVVLIATAVDRLVFDDPIASFLAIDVVFAALLAMLLADVCRRYGASRAATLVLTANLGLCVATAKMFAFYPTLVDLGAYTFMTAAVWAIVMNRRGLAVPLGVLAVLSREFAGVLILFSLWRDLRLRRSPVVAVAAVVPLALAIAWIRWFAASHVTPDETATALTTATLVSSLLGNLALWKDAAYVGIWLYFAVTLFGGVTLAILFTPRGWARCLRREPEWLAIVLPIVAVTVVGYTDIWRYSAFVLPAVAPLWVWTVSDLPPRQASRLFVAVTVATLITQRPWQAMDLASYFRDWFPYFLVIETPRTAAEVLWPLWSYRFAAAAVLAVVVLWLARRPRLVAAPAAASS